MAGSVGPHLLPDVSIALSSCCTGMGATLEEEIRSSARGVTHLRPLAFGSLEAEGWSFVFCSFWVLVLGTETSSQNGGHLITGSRRGPHSGHQNRCPKQGPVLGLFLSLLATRVLTKTLTRQPFSGTGHIFFARRRRPGCLGRRMHVTSQGSCAWCSGYLWSNLAVRHIICSIWP